MDLDLLLIIPILIILGLIVYLIKTKDKPQFAIIGCTIVVIVLGSVTVPFILGDQDGPTPDNSVLSESTTISYDDYYKTDGVSEVSGALEINGDWIHATDVGSATVVFENGREITYTVQKAQLDVFLIMGQSNAAYFHAVPETSEPVPERGQCYYFGAPTRPLIYTSTTTPSGSELTYILSGAKMYSMTNDDGSSKIGNFDAPFAAEYSRLSGHKVYVINTGITATPIEKLVPGGEKYVYASAVFEYGMNAIDLTKYTPTFCAYIWAQGEGNGGNSINSYATQFLQTYNAIKSNTFNADYSTNTCLIVKTRAADGGNASLAQIALSQNYPDIHLASELPDTFTMENGLLDDDNIHYSQKADNLIGVALAKYYFSMS